jgi:hypothetical protein
LRQELAVHLHIPTAASQRCDPTCDTR